MAREQSLVDTFVMLADTLVDEFDVIDFLHRLAERCVEMLDVSAAGIMLVDSQGRLRHAACSNEEMRLVELFELQLEEGPCFDAYRQATPIRGATPEDVQARWPDFSIRAFEAGFIAVSAVPMRLRANVIGALNLFSSRPAGLSDDDIRVAQAMADVATIGILQERAIQDARAFSSQLEVALESRIVIEQAKGIVTEHNKVSVDSAFELIRGFARANNRLLSETARSLINGSLSPEQLVDASAPKKRRTSGSQGRPSS
jgi:GAF domain-containing protein